MDCEKFESAMMDELYGELDELTSAAAKRHIAGCARCAALLGGLRATRRLASVPLVEPPADLEERILAAAREAQKVIPFRRKLAHAVSVAGSWAMRPQTAMAAVFLVMIGTSVLLLNNGRLGRAPASASVTVTEQGMPAPSASAAPVAELAPEPAATAAASVAAAAPPPPAARAAPPRPASLPPPADIAGGERGPAAAKAGNQKDKDDAYDGIYAGQNAAPPGGLPQTAEGSGWTASRGAPAATPAPLGPFDAALQAYQSGRYDDAARAFDALAPADPNADLWAARATREGKGCRAAVTRFDRVWQRAAGTPPAWDALLEGALCYRALGNYPTARSRLTSLLGVDSHKDRAQAELDRLDQLQAQGRVGPAAAKPASPRKAPAPAATTVDAY
jgi:TolA-binding protein